MIEEADVVVVGGGISGLTTAFAVHSRRPDLRLRVLEARSRTGGNIRTERVQDHVIDAGPDSFLRTKPHAIELCRELGLESEFLTTRTQARSAFVVHRGALERLPAGMVLAVPTRLGPMLRTPILSVPSKLRVLCDIVLPARKTAGDESIGDFLTRRFGEQAAARIGAPLLGGIYAGDVSNLSVRATFPQLAELEDRWGSVIYGLFAAQLARASGDAPAAPSGKMARIRSLLAWMQRESDHGQSPFLSLRGGLGTLIDRLAERLPPGTIRTDTPVRAIESESGSFTIRTERGVLRARAVVVCSPAHAAAQFLPSGRLATELGQIPYASTATVFFSLSERALTHPLDGVGFIVPEGESEILASTWVSSKWDARAPAGSVLLRAFLGGVRSPGLLERSDAELVGVAQRELERLMGPLGEPRFTRVYRYERASPQPTVGHPARMERVRAELAALPGLALAGAPYDGVGIPDCVRQGRAAAEAVLGRF
ncbi:MAG TPA: protoporphyrinogen oxidase [Polyangiaceae bacterium]